MPYVLNNITVDDTEYRDATTLRCPGAVQLAVTVANAAVYLQYTIRQGGMSSAALPWLSEVFLPPAMHFRARRADAVRVRAADPDADPAAQVTIEAATYEEVRRP